MANYRPSNVSLSLSIVPLLDTLLCVDMLEVNFDVVEHW
jgi:hypothetical protein